MAVVGSTQWRQEQNAAAARSSGGSSSGTTATTPTPSSGGGGGGGGGYPSGGYKEYTGGNAAMDAQIKGLSDKFYAARDRGDATGMREANDTANQIRNQNGYAAQYATNDIWNIRNQYSHDDSGGGNVYTGQVVQEQSAPAVNSYEQYIREMNQAQQEAAMTALRSAYEQNVASIDTARGNLSPTYTAARNQAAGTAEQQRRQFAEYANANGLGSGAGGQAQLSMNNALQNSLSSIDTQEADAISQLELQRTQTKIQYENAIAQAQQEGNAQLAQQLYQESVRVDEAQRDQLNTLAQQAFQREQFDFTKQQADIANQQADREYQLGYDQWKQTVDKDNSSDSTDILMDYAEKTGDYSVLDGRGYTPEMIANAHAAWLQRMAMTKNPSAGSGGGGRSGTKKTVGIDSGVYALTGDPLSVDSGPYDLSQPPKNIFSVNYGDNKPLTNTVASALANGEDPLAVVRKLSPQAESVLSQARNIPGLTEENKVAVVRDAMNSGRITQTEAERILQELGY